MSLVDLRAFTGLGRSSLGNHVERLERAGYIRTGTVKSFVGRRRVVEITDQGLESCRTLLGRIRSLEM